MGGDGNLAPMSEERYIHITVLASTEGSFLIPSGRETAAKRPFHGKNRVRSTRFLPCANTVIYNIHKIAKMAILGCPEIYVPVNVIRICLAQLVFA